MIISICNYGIFDHFCKFEPVNMIYLPIFHGNSAPGTLDLDIEGVPVQRRFGDFVARDIAGCHTEGHQGAAAECICFTVKIALGHFGSSCVPHVTGGSLVA